MTDLTFTRLLTDGGLRHWDLKGPAGLIRYETTDTSQTARVYLHAAVAPGGGDLEPCDVCGRCWRDAMVDEHAEALREDWAGAAYHDAVIRTQLERWYTENLATWAVEADLDDIAPEYVRQVESTPDADDQAVPAKDLAMLLAEHAPGLPYVDLGRLAAALDKAGYQVTRKTTGQAGAPC